MGRRSGDGWILGVGLPRHAAKNGRTKDRETARIDVDEILPEYDFSGALLNKYASRYAAGGMVVVLDRSAGTSLAPDE
jgi:hypothetical protein